MVTEERAEKASHENTKTRKRKLWTGDTTGATSAALVAAHVSEFELLGFLSFSWFRVFVAFFL
jgi:hypothetical protein